MQKVLANVVVLSGFVAIPFIPFIVLSHSSFFPYITGKNFAFRAVVEIMAAAYIVLAVVDPAYRPRRSLLWTALISLLVIMGVAAILGPNPEKSFWSNFERMEGLVTYFHLFAYILISATVLTVRDLWRPYLNLHLTAGVLMAIYGLAQIAGHDAGYRIDGTLGNSSYLGIYAYFNIFIALYFMARHSMTAIAEKWRIVLYGAIALLQLVVVYYTGTRGVVLGIIVGLGIATLLVVILERNKKVWRRTAIGILIALALLVGGFYVARNSTFVQSVPLLARFSQISLTESNNARFMVWDMAIKGFEERPIFGWGMENFNYVFNKYYNPGMYGQEQWFDRAHNVLFDWLVTGGILGFLAYLSLFACALYYIWKRDKDLSVLEKSVFTGLLGGYFFQNLFVFDNITSLIFFGTIIAYVESFSTAPILGEKIKIPSDAFAPVGWGAAVLAVVLVYAVNYNGFMQNIELVQGISQQFDAGPTENLKILEGAIARNSFGTAEAREQLGQVAVNGFGHAPGQPISDIQKEFIVTAASELMKQAAELPEDARYQLFAGSFLLQTGQVDQALPYLLKAHALSPNKQTIIFTLGNAYYIKGDKAKTEEMFKEAYDLDPAYDNARAFYGKILTENGKTAEAKKVLGQ